MKYYTQGKSCDGDCSDCTVSAGWYKERPYCAYEHDEYCAISMIDLPLTQLQLQPALPSHCVH